MPCIKGIQVFNQKIDSSVITIGNFDGVHLGHQKIIQSLLAEAMKSQSKSIVFTFRPHPQVVLRESLKSSSSVSQLLSEYDEKIILLEKLGVDWIIEEPFTLDFSKIEPKQFFLNILIKKFKAKCIVVGYDFAFGKERNGHLQLLEDLCKTAHVKLIIVPPEKIDHEIISSSKIRQFLYEHKISDANHFLGRKFSYFGKVIEGESRGHSLGFPTANIEINNKLILPYGVYATQTEVHFLEKKITYPSVTNIGIRPTFTTENSKLIPLVETHIINEKLNLYGNSIEIKFIQFLRNEIKFKDRESLADQIKKDVLNAQVAHDPKSTN